MYLIIELQTQADGSTAHLVFTETERCQAESVFHQKLAYAAVSDLPFHAVVLMDHRGAVLRQWCYEHPPKDAGSGDE